MDGINIIEYLDNKLLEYRIRNNEIILANCPYCEIGNKKSFSHFYINQEKEVFYCQKCGAGGNYYKLLMDMGDISLITKAKERKYQRPKENCIFTASFKTEKYYKCYEKERFIDHEILNKYKVGVTTADGYLIIVYQYYDENNILFNRKYRDFSKEKMWTEKNAEHNFYGLQFIDFKKSHLLVCAGEDDCHSLVQLGFDNVVSIPYGDRNFSEQMSKITDKFQDIFILFDNDLSGQEGAKKFAEKAGLMKCQNIILPYKDARECLKYGLNHDDIMKFIGKAEYFKHDEIMKAIDYKEEFMKFINDEGRFIGKSIRIKSFNYIVGGLRPAELTILTGHTGRGKSTYAYNVTKWAEEVGFHCMILSFEGSLSPVIQKLIEIYSEEAIRVFCPIEHKTKSMQSKEWISKWFDKIDSKNIYFLNKKYIKEGYYDVNQLINVIECANKFFDINFFVIDHLHYFLKLSSERNPVQKIDESIRRIKQLTIKLDIHILLIVHPHMTDDNKKGETQKLGLNCVKGASSISQEADNFWVVCRKGEDNENFSRIEIKKNRSLGKLGFMDFKVLDNMNTFIEV